MKSGFIALILICCCILFTRCNVNSVNKQSAPLPTFQENKEMLKITGEVNKTFHEDKPLK